MNKLNHEHVVGIVCILLAVVVLLVASTFPNRNSDLNIPGPDFFPMVLSIIFILCGIYQIVLGFVKDDFPAIDFKALFEHIRSRKVIVLFVVLALVLFFIIFNEIIGFIPCVVILLVAIMKLLGVPWLSTFIGTASLTALIIFLFAVVFHVSLPSGLLYYVGL